MIWVAWAGIVVTIVVIGLTVRLYRLGRWP
jgi:hypothetical protein